MVVLVFGGIQAIDGALMPLDRPLQSRSVERTRRFVTGRCGGPLSEVLPCAVPSPVLSAANQAGAGAAPT